jgi:hypothetical protein
MWKNFIVLFIGIASAAQADEATTDCIGLSWSAKRDNWAILTNQCNTPISVWSGLKDGSHTVTQGILQPGKAMTIGFSEKDISKGGGLNMAVCMMGQSARTVDGTREWKSSDDGYSCR